MTEPLSMTRVTFNITCRCSLKCRLCGAYIPYLQNGSEEMTREYPLEHWFEITDRCFEIVSHIGVLAVSGGEPLLYPDLPGFLRYLMRYRDAIGQVQIVTNGTIIPDQDLLDAATEYGEGLYFQVDDYGANVSRKVEEIGQILTEHQIPYLIRNYTKDNPHCGGWVDFGGLTERIHETAEETEQLFSKCANAQKVHFCFLIAGDEMWPCDPARRRRYLAPPEDDREYIRLMDHSLSAEEQRQKIRAIYELKSLSACAYCNGLCEDSVRVIPGEQLTPEELRCIRDGARSYKEVRSMIE